MATLLLLDGSNNKIIVSQNEMIRHLCQRLIADALKADFLLSLSEEVPQLSPNRIAGSRAEQLLHFIAAVARVQWRLHVVSNCTKVMVCNCGIPYRYQSLTS